MVRCRVALHFLLALVAACVASSESAGMPPDAGRATPYLQDMDAQEGATPLRWRLRDRYLGRSYPAVVLDPVADRLLLIGGYPGFDSRHLDDSTWELPLAGPYEWTRVDAAGVPALLGNELAIFDPVQRSMMLYSVFWERYYSPLSFWQSMKGGPTGEQWGPDPAFGFPYPSGLVSPAHAYDSIRDRHLFFGGYWQASEWAYTGTNDLWAIRTVPPAREDLGAGSPLRPSIRAGAGLVFDASRDCVWMWGGGWYDNADSDLWTFGMSGDRTWSMRPTVGQIPPPLSGHALVLDAARDRLLVWGGTRVNASQSPPADVIWALDLSSGEWRELHISGGPAVVGFSTVLMDARRSRLIVLAHTAHPRIELWSLALDETPRWDLLAAFDGWQYPAERMMHAMALDEETGSVFIVGGHTDQRATTSLGLSIDIGVQMVEPSLLLRDAARGWVSARPNLSSAVEQLEAVFDRRERRFLYYGGKGYLDGKRCHHCTTDYWHENGIVAVRWGETPQCERVASAGPVPPSRARHAMAYDAIRHRLLVFGGQAFGGSFEKRSDLWSFDLTEKIWTQLEDTHEPPPGSWLGFHDEPTDRLVVVGRDDPSLVYVLDLSAAQLSWVRKAIPAVAAGYEYDVCLDTYRRRLILVASTGLFALALDEGSGWARLQVANSIPSIAGHQVVYDADLDRIILNGGVRPRTAYFPVHAETPRSDTWTLDFGDPVRHLALDIRPGEEDNLVNLRSRGLLPIAILGDAQTDAGTIDPSTVRVGGAPVQRRPNGSWMSEPRDVDGDGWMDLFAHVETESLSIGVEDSILKMIARGTSGWRAKGVAEVQIVGRSVPVRGQSIETAAHIESPPLRLEVRGVQSSGRPALSLSLPSSGEAELALFDVTGRSIMTRILHVERAGRQIFHLEAKPAAGIYFARLRQADAEARARVLVLR